MPLDEFAKMASAVVHYLYRFGEFCITVGLFLFVVMLFKTSTDFGVIPLRLILLGFGFIFWDASLWKELKRVYALGFMVIALIPTHFYLAAYAYLK
jgi:hypothetical protein